MRYDLTFEKLSIEFETRLREGEREREGARSWRDWDGKAIVYEFLLSFQETTCS